MRVLVVSGIWPPDVGGPASHAPEVADGLMARGHDVEVVTTAVSQPGSRAYRVRYVSRALPHGVLHGAVCALVARRARSADVVYATGMLGRSSVGAALSRTPLVVKVAGDPAYERSFRRGFYSGTLIDFEHAALGTRAAALRRWRTVATRRAAHVFCPSEFLRSVVVSWGVPPERVTVLPNATPVTRELPPRDELRRRFGIDGPTLAFAGRLTPQKSLDDAFAAVEGVDGVTLLLAGEGEERARLEALGVPRVRFLGALARERVLELFAAADGSLLSSAWENFPHAVVEALSVGTPVIATDVGGVSEIVQDGVNGLLAPTHNPEALGAAVRRYFADDALRARLRAAAARSVERFSPEHVLDTLESVLERMAR
jgi:glycosyltransferase involved in cell wall biosynthesis